MSNFRFIELSSSHRNRIQYPNPSEFEVPFSPSRSLNTNQTLKGAYYNNNTSGSYSQILNQSLDVADTITNGIVEYQWSGVNRLYDTGYISTLPIPTGTGPYTYTGAIISGLSQTYTGPFPLSNYNIVINNSQISLSITSSTTNTITCTFTSTIILGVNVNVQITTNNSISSLGIPVINYFDTSTLQNTSSNISTITKIYVNVNGLQSPYKNIPNYYLGYLLIVKNGIAGIIASYTPSQGLFTLETPILTTQTLSSGDDIWIVDPSNASSSPSTLSATVSLITSTFTKPAQTIVLPQIDDTGKTILQYDQAYNGYYLIDETLSASTGSPVYSQISSHNFLENTITLANPISNWLNTDLYTIRKSLPSSFFATIQGTSQILTQVPNPNDPLNPFPQITLTNCIFLPQSASSVDNSYAGQYIYLYPPKVLNNQLVSNTPLTNIEGTAYYINSYIGNLTIGGSSYRVCFVTPLIVPNVANPTQFYPSYQTSPPVMPPSGTVINIVSFKGDNYTPLIYNGSVVSQNETVAYEISLVNLTLPNILLVSGSRAAYYPYIYVQLSNVTASSSSSKNVIYSNNPNSYNALFLVPITDITDPLRSPFIKLDAGSMVQTVKFKPNDCLRFSVFLPNGEEYLTVMSDYYSPSAPNVLVQIDALFGIRRLTGV